MKPLVTWWMLVRNFPSIESSARRAAVARRAVAMAIDFQWFMRACLVGLGDAGIIDANWRGSEGGPSGWCVPRGDPRNESRNDAERRGGRSHAERGNEKENGRSRASS